MGLSLKHVFSSKNGNKYYISIIFFKFCKHHQIVKTTRKILKYGTYYPLNRIYRRIYHDVSVICIF